MRTRLLLAFVASMALGVGLPAGASPITYDFTGTLNSPYNGSNQFSGSFTINGDPTPSGSPPLVIDNGASLTLNIGGNILKFGDQTGSIPGSSFTYAGFYVGPIQTSTPLPAGSPQFQSGISAGFDFVPGQPPPLNFSLQFLNSTELASNLSDLRSLYFPLKTSAAFLSYNGSSILGSVTSIELVPTAAPEPSTLAVFAVLGIAAMAHRRYRRV